MAFYSISPNPIFHADDLTGNPLSGGKVFFYYAGTSTKAVTWTDSSGTSQNTNPVILNSRGEAQIWMVGTYKIILSPPTDSDPPTSPIWTVDNFTAGASQILTVTRPIGTNYTTTPADNSTMLLVDASTGAIAIQLLLPASAGNGYNVTIKKIDSSANLVTVTVSGGADIDAADSYILQSQESAAFITNGIQYFIETRIVTLRDPINNGIAVIPAGVPAAVNQLTVTNSAIGGGVSVAATGTDLNIPLEAKSKGTANFIIDSPGIQLKNNQSLLDGSGNALLSFVSLPSAVNHLQVLNSGTNKPVMLAATGADSEISIIISPKAADVLLPPNTALLFYNPTPATYCGFKAPTGIVGNPIWELPTTDGTNGQAIITNGSQQLSFASVGLLAASRSEMEAATSNTVAVTPAGQQFHPSAVKAWVLYHQDSGTAMDASYNVSSVTSPPATSGTANINFAVPFASDTYACTTSTLHSNSGVLGIISRTSTVLQVLRFNASSGAHVDTHSNSVMCCGVLAA